MKYTQNVFFLSAVITILSCNCATRNQVAPKPKQPMPNLPLFGTWYAYNEKEPVKVTNSPLFELLPPNQFVDSLQILCHIDKFQQGDILQVISRLLGSEEPQKLENCPTYRFEQEGTQIRIKSSQSPNLEPKYIIDFSDLKSEIKLSKNRKGKWFMLYTEIKTQRSVAGIMVMQPDSIRASRISVVLVK